MSDEPTPEPTPEPEPTPDYDVWFKEILNRLDIIEERLGRLPCDHIGFPIDEDYEFDGESENRVEVCRNCGDKV
jgi:hypothetical protein|tara:strand:+ start:578 stop:799 length:222 start_codon:yes stop_codon:yes gene_type:complete